MNAGRTSESPAARRKRAQRERERTAAAVHDQLELLGAHITLKKPASEPSSPPAPASGPANDNIPLHETTPVQGAGADAYAGAAELPPRTEGAQPTPIVPETKTTIGENGEPIAAGRAPVSAEEAKAFAMLVVGYFQFGSQQLFLKHPEFLDGLLAMAGTHEKFAQGFQFASSFVGQSAEHCALKYNLRIPYVQEAVVIGAIGVATFGLAGKPSKRGEAELGRARAAKNANPPAGASASSSPAAADTATAAPAAADTFVNDAGKTERVDPDEAFWR